MFNFFKESTVRLKNKLYLFKTKLQQNRNKIATKSKQKRNKNTTKQQQNQNFGQTRS